MTVLLDRGMDISYLSYKSIPMCWRSATRETSPVFFENKGAEWLRSFCGGLFTTCGLASVGAPSVDNGEEFALHGRISNLSAENVCVDGKWEGDNYEMFISGKVREAKVFGDKLELRRKITVRMDTPKILVEDTVENIGSVQSPIMILYHINVGYPVLDKNSQLLEGKAKVSSLGEDAEKEISEFAKFSDPTIGYGERCYIHDIEADSEGNSNVAIVNPDFNNGQGIGLWVKYSKENLPNLLQWKMMGVGEYVCGLEPVNNLMRGRKTEREKGGLKFIKPGQKLDYSLEFNILTSNEDIEKFKSKFC